MVLIKCMGSVIDTETNLSKDYGSRIETYKDYVIIHGNKNIGIYNFYTNTFYQNHLSFQGKMRDNYLVRQGRIFKINPQNATIEFFYIIQSGEKIVTELKKLCILHKDYVKILNNDVWYKLDYKNAGKDNMIIIREDVVCFREDTWKCINYKTNTLVCNLESVFYPVHFYNFMIANSMQLGHCIIFEDGIKCIGFHHAYWEDKAYSYVSDNVFAAEDLSSLLFPMPSK